MWIITAVIKRPLRSTVEAENIVAMTYIPFGLVRIMLTNCLSFPRGSKHLQIQVRFTPNCKNVVI